MLLINALNSQFNTQLIQYRSLGAHELSISLACLVAVATEQLFQ